MIKYLTKEGLEKLKKELEYLEKVKRKEISERLNHVISQGDLTENAGYDAVKDEQGFVEEKIKELRKIIGQSRIIKNNGNGKIQIGSFVYLTSGELKEKFQLVGPEEADISKKKISFKCPLGEALLNKRKGDKMIIRTPDGKKEYKIIEIE